MKMQCSNDLQNKYTELYKQLREYIWDFKTVEIIAELEIAVATAFPDRDDVRKNLKNLYYQIKDYFEENEEMKSAYEEFNNYVESEDTFYGKLGKVNEVIK